MSIEQDLITIASNMQGIYDKGFADGQAQGGGGDNGFWDGLLNNGERTDCANLFRNGAWNDTNFKPKYKIRPINATSMLQETGMVDCDIGEYVDFSQCTTVNACFLRCKLKRLPVLDFTSVSRAASQTFAVMESLVNVEKIIVNPDSGISFPNGVFVSCAKLKEIRFEGALKFDVYIQNSPLSVESMKDIISHLANCKGTGDEGLYTVKFSNSCWNTLEASGVAPDGGTWKQYVINLGWLT